MRIEFTIDANAVFNAVMDKTILDKAGLEAQSGAQLGDKFALSKSEADAFLIELDNAINHLCFYLPMLEWEPNEGIDMAIESKKNVAPSRVGLLISKALEWLMLVWWYELRHPNYAALAEQRSKTTIGEIRRLVEGSTTERPYRFF